MDYRDHASSFTALDVAAILLPCMSCSRMERVWIHRSIAKDVQRSRVVVATTLAQCAGLIGRLHHTHNVSIIIMSAHCTARSENESFKAQLRVCKHTLHGGSLSIGGYMPCGGYFHARHRCPGSEQTWWRSAPSCPHWPPVLHEPEPCCAAPSSCSGEPCASAACLGSAAITRRSGCMQLCHRSTMCSRKASCAQR